jgi:hypothetical protein
MEFVSYMFQYVFYMLHSTSLVYGIRRFLIVLVISNVIFMFMFLNSFATVLILGP